MTTMKTRAEADHTLAVFIDFENMALGFNARRDRFDIGKVLERLVEKGKIVVKKAYCDWSRFGNYTASLHEAAIELIEIPKRSATGKNSADIRLVVDAIDLAYSKDHINTFVIVSGDSDFSPLVSKLKELGKHVIGLGLQDATSELLRDNCDEFLYYEDLGRAPIVPIHLDHTLPENKQKVFALLMDSLLALRRENKDTIFSSMIKDTMKRKKPSFNEEYFGYRTFSELLEDAEKHGLLDLEKHKNSGTYVVIRFGAEPKSLNRVRQESSPSRLEPAQRNETKRSTDPSPRHRGRRVPAPGRERSVPPIAAEPLSPLDAPPTPILGRELLEAVETFDDEIPTYSPRRVTKTAEPKPVTPAKPAAKTPTTRKKEVVAPPREAAPPPVPAAPQRKRIVVKAAEPIPPSPTVEVSPPNPVSNNGEEESSFGAGLDL